MLLRLSIVDPRKTSSDLKRDMMDYGVHLSNSSIKKRLFEAGRNARRPKRKQLLTHKMKRKRLAWAKKYKNWTLDDWKKVLFSDETHFVVGGKHVQYVRRSVGESVKPCHINQQVKHPAKKMFWGCFSFKGVGSLFPVQGMMKSDQYIEVIQRRVIPDMQKAFSNGNDTFQQDLAPCHSSKQVNKFFSDHSISVLDWPNNSPDLNPIENLWAIMKRRVKEHDCTTMTKLMEATVSVWYRDQEHV